MGDTLLRCLSLLGWEHINLTDCLWRGCARIGARKFRPLRPLDEAWRTL